MPDITEERYGRLIAYEQLGPPEDIRKKREELEKDNAKQRGEITDLKEKLPADGMVVVPKDKADALAAYEALGKPEEIQATQTERDTLKAEAAQRSRTDLLRKAGKAAFGTDSAGDVLDGIRGSEAWTVEVVEEEADGKKAPVAYVIPAEGQPKKKLVEYVTEAHAAFVPALKATTENGGGGGGGTTFIPSGSAEKKTEAGKATTDDQRKAVRSRVDYSV